MYVVQEHLIPQDITNYRFHLIGELDLKQFLELAVLGGLAALTYATNLPAIIKWPLIVLFVAVGLIAAFVPIADQPLSHWLTVFFKNLRAPTKFYWKKSEELPPYFTFELKPQYVTLVEGDFDINYTPVKKLRAKDYFTTIEENQESVDHLEIFGHSNLNSVVQSFEQVNVAKDDVTVTKQVVKPNVNATDAVRARPMVIPTAENVEAFLNNTSIFTPQKVTGNITDIAAADTAPNLHWPRQETPAGATNSILQTSEEEIAAAAVVAAQVAPAAATPIVPDATPAVASAAAPAAMPTVAPTTAPATTPAAALAPTVNPDSNPTTTTATATANTAEPPANTEPSPTPNTDPSVLRSPLSYTSHALTGTVLGTDTKPLADAIISVYDQHKNLKLLKKTTAEGNFTTGQLVPGTYTLTTRFNNLNFPTLEVTISAHPPEPLSIQATA